jgi:PLP dependent protein
MSIAERWKEVRARVDAACARASRDPAEVTIVAVSKTHPASAVIEAAAAGATDFGENYVQELVAKRGELTIPVRWHYIGRLQRNKAKAIAGQVALIHAVDTIELAQELGKRNTSGAPQPILLALSGEASKAGVTAGTAGDVALAIEAIQNVRLDGLMTMPPPDEDPEASRPAFLALRALRDELQKQLRRPLPVLSMGMSGDFEVAIECGATHVRIGTAIFGQRPPLAK